MQLDQTYINDLKRLSELKNELLESTNTNTILIKLGNLIEINKRLVEDYYFIKDAYEFTFVYDAKEFQARLDELMIYIREADFKIDHTHGQSLHELVNIVLETTYGEFGLIEFKFFWYEYNAFFFSTGKNYKAAIPKFKRYIASMKDNPFLDIKRWLAHNEYIKCLYMCRNDKESVASRDELIKELELNKQMYSLVHSRLKRKTIPALKYLSKLNEKTAVKQ